MEQKQQAKFNDKGITIIEGWALIHNADSKTGEYQNSTYEYLPVGVGLPAHAYLDAPNDVDAEHAIVRNGDKWTYPADHRTKKIYSTENGAESTVTTIGDIPVGFTLLKPNSDFDSWNGKKWVLDKEKQHQHDIKTAQSQKLQLINETNGAISNLQDAVDADIANEQQVKMLKKLKGYRFELNQIDVDKAPNIEWPQMP